jgi:hypothetical protein
MLDYRNMMANKPHTPEDVARIVDAIFVSAQARKACLGHLADAIVHADSLEPDRWGLTVRPNWMRLNVGNIEVMGLGPGWAHLVLNRDDVPQKLYADNRLTLGGGRGASETTLYRSVIGSVSCDFEQRFAEALLPALRDLHFASITRAAATRRHTATKQGHTPVALEYLEQALGRKLPSPLYTTAEAGVATASHREALDGGEN